MTSRRAFLFAAVVALLQIGFLGWMIQGRASILQNGREILLRVQPVDPRDLLRGDYVRLGYEAAEFPASLVQGLAADAYLAYGDNMLVRLAKQPDGYWAPVAAVLGTENPAPLGTDQVDLHAKSAGETTDENNVRKLFVDYGIERFYVPEGEGLAIEKDMRVRPFGILAAVDDDGNPQIKSLMDGDVMLYAEPLY